MRTVAKTDTFYNENLEIAQRYFANITKLILTCKVKNMVETRVTPLWLRVMR